jgi:metallophosphoesterase (TIGR03767 family)
MSGPVSKSAAASALNRRTFLLASGATAVGTGLGIALGPATDRATASPTATETAATATAASAHGLALAVPTRAGTTLQAVATGSGTGGYRRLVDGPGWQQVVRTELATAKSGREDRRTALACFVQFTDLHLTDAQSPLRTEFLRAAQTSAWRPQETLTLAGITTLVERVNALRGGPVTGVPVDFVMTTGDNTDSNSQLELQWFLTAMSGGRITPNSGHPRDYEGVQDSGLKMFWQPDAALRDADKQRGFPRLNGFLAAAIRQVTSPGLTVPWYSTVGNHDMLGSGAYAHGSFWADLATGSRKLESIPAAAAVKLIESIRSGKDPKGTAVQDVFRAYARKARTVTADERRAPFTAHQYIAAHLDPAYKGAGPVGHGYTTANLIDSHMYYTFRISDDVLGISLDTTDRGGHYTGSIGTAQLSWLERTLAANKDLNVLVFSHHTSTSMENYTPDPARPDEKRHGGAELVALLKRHPNVLAWVNGHSHRNEITPQGTFWEVNTASHVDYPQLARVIELVDNHDGTLSLFTTLVESAAPHRTDFGDLSQTGLAALYRELAFNQPERSTRQAGAPKDRNTELLLKKR